MPITWGSLLGVTLLWGRFDHPGWQRRVGLLLVMSLVDAGLWFLDHGAALGLAEGDLGHDWLRGNVGQALGWAEFALMAGLSCDYLEHLGVEYARESGKSTRSMAATGAVVWLLLFCQRTDWSAGWPLVPHRIRSIEEFLLFQASHLIWAITLIQVTSLAISAARMSGAGPGRDAVRGRGQRPLQAAVGMDRGAGRPRRLTASVSRSLDVRASRPGHDDPAGSNSRSDFGKGKWTLSSRIVSSRMVAPKLRWR